MKIIILLIIVNLCSYIYPLYIPFSSKEDFLHKCESLTIDTLVLIAFKFTTYNDSIIKQNTVRDFYLSTRDELIQIINKTFPLNYNETSINEQIAFFPNNTTPKQISQYIKQTNWFFKVKWVINGENYQIKTNNKLAKIGSVINYVNYLNETNVNQYLYSLLHEHTELQQYQIFEREVMNLNYLKNDTVLYIKDITSHPFLIALALRTNHYASKINHINFSCDETKKIMNFSVEQSKNYIIEKIKGFNILKNIDNFINIIVNNEHAFIKVEELVKTFTNETILQKYALYAEYFHRKASRKPKSFTHLNEYITKIPPSKIQTYLINELNLHPELTKLSYFNDLEALKKTTTIFSVKSIMDTLSRVTLLRWIYNLQVFHLKNSFVDENNKNKLEFDTFTDKLFYMSTSSLKNGIIRLISMKYELFESIEEIMNVAEPCGSLSKQFYHYLNSFPQLILAKFLEQIIKYDYQRTSKKRLEVSTYSLQKQMLIDLICFFFNFRTELVSFEMFGNLIDIDKDGILYGSFSAFVNVHSKDVVKKWAILFEKYYKTRNSIMNINGEVSTCILESYVIDGNGNFENKNYYINLLSYYAHYHPELKTPKFFYTIVGMTPFHNTILSLSYDNLIKIAKRFYIYYQIKMFKLKHLSYAELPYSFDEFIQNENNLYHIQRYIFKVATVFPETKLTSAYEEIINYDNFNETLTSDDLGRYLNELYEQEGKIYSLAYKCLKFRNATLAQTKKIEIDLSKYTLKQLALFIKHFVVAQYNLLLNEWNFARLALDQGHFLYGGYEPFISRQTNFALIRCLNNIRNIYGNNEYIVSEEYFIGLNDNDKRLYITNFISQHIDDFQDIKQLKDVFVFNKVDRLIDISQKTKEDLISYALVSQYFIEEKHLEQKYGLIWKNIRERTRNEIEDYLAETYEELKDVLGSVDNYEMYSMLLGFKDREIDMKLH